MAKIGRPSVREKVFAALPGIRNRVAKRAGVAVSSAGIWIDAFHAEGLIYISEWRTQKGNGARLPLYRFKVKGTEVDKPRPPAMNDEDYQRRYDERYPHRRAEIRKAYEQRERAAAEKRKKQGQSWASMLATPISKPVLAKNFPAHIEQVEEVE